LSNSISVATRERRVEMAVLKVLGFEPVVIMALVVGEAMLLGAVSGFVGAALAWLSSTLAVHGFLPSNPATRIFFSFPIQAAMVLWGALLGALGSIVPAWNAWQVKVSDVFAKIA
jgi:putative ABC transport system permease protein